MSRATEWRKYLNSEGDFEIAAYLYKLILDLMKTALDMGTLLSEDPQRLRAYKEQIKVNFKNAWFDLAAALEFFEIIVPCGCDDEFCRMCKGARYRLNAAITPDEMREIAVAVSADYANDPNIQEKLQEGLAKALKDMEVFETENKLQDDLKMNHT